MFGEKKRINNEYPELDLDVPVYRVPIYSLSPFSMLLGLYRRIVFGCWLCAYKVREKDTLQHTGYIVVAKGLPRRVERDVLKHECNHSDVDTEDLPTDYIEKRYFLPSSLTILTGSCVTILGFTNLGGIAVFAGAFYFAAGFHKLIESMEETVNEDIDWDKHYDVVRRDLPKSVNTVFDFFDGIMHSLAAVLGGVFRILLVMFLRCLLKIKHFVI